MHKLIDVGKDHMSPGSMCDRSSSWGSRRVSLLGEYYNIELQVPQSITLQSTEINYDRCA